MPNIGSYLQNNSDHVNFRDFRHASRLYLDGGYKLTPKAGWLYYVSFELESNVLRDAVFNGRKKIEEVGMLVKQADLPKFQINTEVMNQYNRKTIIQKNITYQPVSFTLHDDGANYVNDLWTNYYRYYYNDGKLTGNTPLGSIANTAINGLLGANVGNFVSRLAGTSRDPAKGPYGNTKYRKSPDDDILTPVSYGLNSPNVNKPFFRSITLYQLNQHKFVSYQLVNPMIKTWEHDRLDQTQGNRLLESKMQVEYESVFYGKGSVSRDNPAGFAVFHYDNEPSPLGVGASGLTNIIDDALVGASNIFGDVLGEFVPPGGSTLLDAIGAVRNVTNLTGIVAGNFASQSKTNSGYSTLSTGSVPQQFSLNGLGTNLNLNLNNNSSINGVVNGSQINVAPAINISNAQLPTPIIASNPATISGNMSQTLAAINNIISYTQPPVSNEDTTPNGNTPAPGNYFTMPVPLADTTPFVASNIDSNSNITAINNALKILNTSWANDNDFVANQILNPNDVSQKLNAATSEAEFNAIKSSANAVISATENLQITVNNKYQSEFDRLTTLLTAKQTNVYGSINLA